MGPRERPLARAMGPRDDLWRGRGPTGDGGRATLGRRNDEAPTTQGQRGNRHTKGRRCGGVGLPMAGQWTAMARRFTRLRAGRPRRETRPKGPQARGCLLPSLLPSLRQSCCSGLRRRPPRRAGPPRGEPCPSWLLLAQHPPVDRATRGQLIGRQAALAAGGDAKVPLPLRQPALGPGVLGRRLVEGRAAVLDDPAQPSENALRIQPEEFGHADVASGGASPGFRVGQVARFDDRLVAAEAPRGRIHKFDANEAPLQPRFVPRLRRA